MLQNICVSPPPPHTQHHQVKLSLSLLLSFAEHRREKQEQMEKQLNESTLHRLTAGQNGSSGREEAAKGRLISQVQAYRNLTDVPQTRDLQVRGARDRGALYVGTSVCVFMLEGRCVKLWCCLPILKSLMPRQRSTSCLDQCMACGTPCPVHAPIHNCLPPPTPPPSPPTPPHTHTLLCFSPVCLHTHKHLQVMVDSRAEAVHAPIHNRPPTSSACHSPPPPHTPCPPCPAGDG